MIEERLRERILSNPTVSGLIHGVVSPVVLPQNSVYPAVTYNRVSTSRISTLTDTSGLANPRFQVSIFDKSYATVRAVASGIRVTLDGTERTRLVNEYDLYDDAARTHYTVLDFMIWHEE